MTVQVLAQVVPVCVPPAAAAVAVFVVEDLGARLHSGAAVAASVAPLVEDLVYVPRSAWIAVAAVSSALVDWAELAVVALLSALVAAPVFLLVLPVFAPAVGLLRQHDRRSVVQSEFVSAVVRAAAFAGEHLYCLAPPRQLFVACVPRRSLVQLDLMFDLLPPVAHPGAGAFGF